MLTAQNVWLMELLSEAAEVSLFLAVKPGGGRGKEPGVESGGGGEGEGRGGEGGGGGEGRGEFPKIILP